MTVIVHNSHLQLQLDLSDQRHTAPNNWAQIPSGRDGSTLILRLCLLQTDHLDHGVPHAMITINHVNNDLFAPTLEHEVAHILGNFL